MSKMDSLKSGQHNIAFDRDEINTQDHNHETPVKIQVAEQKVTYTWENINVHVKYRQGNAITRLYKTEPVIRKQILSNVTGVVHPGQFLAIMGASGAGKTTLLNCLNFRNSGNLKVSGKRCINGSPISTDSLARLSGYVQQDDLFIGTLTVYEQLRFQALLRMEKGMPYAQRMERVEKVIQEMGLTKSAHTMIGNPARGVKGVSGGEKKRLAFASEILTDPPLLFCDEPTSGLDSYMAQNVVQTLKNLASSGKTIICTIHQPSSEVFAMFDRILLMAEGRTAFLGPVDQAMNFFSSQGLPCPANYNPADFYIHTLATVPGQEVQSRQAIYEICDNFKASQNGHELFETIQKSYSAVDYVEHNQDAMKVHSPYKASWWAQFLALLWRSWLTVIREPIVLRVKAFQTLFIGGLIAAIFQGQSYTFKNLPNIQGALFIFITNMTQQNLFGVINVFTMEIPLFRREHFNGMYRTDAYFLAKTLADVPVYIIFPFIFLTIPYFAIGFNPAGERYFAAAGIVILVANTVISFGYFMSCLTASVQVAQAVTAPILVPMMLFGGFFLRPDSIPVYFEWLSYLSWFKYGNELLSINQWSGFTFNDTTSVYPGGPPTCPDGVCTGEFILKTFAFNPDNYWRDVGCMFAMIVGFRTLALLALLSKTSRK